MMLGGGKRGDPPCVWVCVFVWARMLWKGVQEPLLAKSRWESGGVLIDGRSISPVMCAETARNTTPDFLGLSV